MMKRRVFKTAGFAKLARKVGLSEAILCKAFKQLLAGQADSLGGGVFKKRLNDNQHRSIVLVKGAKLGVFEFLYAKQDKANLSPDELKAFRLLAQRYECLKPLQLSALIANRSLVEICSDPANDIQK